MGKRRSPDNSRESEELSAERERILMQGKTKRVPLNLPIVETAFADTSADTALPEPEKEKTSLKKVSIPHNSRLYTHFSKIFEENQYDQQNNYSSLESYLEHTLIDIQKGEENLPPGCETVDDLLKPYWETEKVAGIPMSSLFALEYGLEFQENKQLREQNKNSFGRYLSGLLKPFRGTSPEDGEVKPELTPNIPGLPEEARDFQDAIRPLTAEEVKAWFKNRLTELEKQFQKAGNRNYKQLAYRTYAHIGYEKYKNQFFPKFEEVSAEPKSIGPDDQAYHGLNEPSQNDYFAYKQRKIEKKNAPISQTHRVEEVTHDLLGKSRQPIEPSQEFLDKFYESEDGKKFEVVAGEVLPIRKADFELHGNQLAIKFERRLEKDGVFEYAPGGHVSVNLPPELAANFSAYKKEAEEILRAIVIENKGKWKPEIVNKIGDISFGLGDFVKSREIFKLAPLLLRKLSPELYSRYSWYIDLKTKPNKKLDRETERLPMKDYEDRLLKLPVKDSASGRETTLSQYVWDSAFRKDLEAKLGADKLKQLKNSKPVAPVEAKPVTKDEVKINSQAPVADVKTPPVPPPASPEQTKFRKEPKTENKLEDKQIPPDAAYYPDFQSVQKIMDKYGRLDLSVIREEGLSAKTLEHSLAAMGFLKDYQQGLGNYKNTAAYQRELIDRVRREQDGWLRNGRTVSEAEAFKTVEQEMEYEILVKAVENLYQIRPETLKFEAEKLKVPENFEEVKYFFQPQCIIMRDQVSGFEYFGIPGPRGAWDRVPLPDNVNIDNPEDIQTMYDTFSAMTQENIQPIIQLKNAAGGNFRDGVFEIYIDRILVKSVPVKDFINRDLVRSDVRNLDRNNEIYKELLVTNFEKLQHNQSSNFAQRDNRVQALQDLLLNTPIEDNVSFGDEAKFAALKRRLANLKKERVKGSIDVKEQGKGFVTINKQAA